MFDQFRPGNFDGGRVWYELSRSTENAQLSLLGIFMVAIAEFEGFYITDPPSISRRNLNPGNLRPIGASQGFRTFPTANDGWEALKLWIVTGKLPSSDN